MSALRPESRQCMGVLKPTLFRTPIFQVIKSQASATQFDPFLEGFQVGYLKRTVMAILFFIHGASLGMDILLIQKNEEMN
jgi:hypothetical protein